MGVKSDLGSEYGEKRTRLPPSTWNLSKAEKRIVCKYFYGMKTPESYASNVKSLVSMQDLKLYGLKSHDCHTLMQQLLLIAIRSVLEKPVRYAIIRLCLFFNDTCNKVIDVSRLDKIHDDVVVTLCLLEKYFPPSFFDVMIHLVVHLVREIQVCGPALFRWMYPFERFMKVLKGYVRNRNRPEGCIAQCYIGEEASEFCSDFLSNVSTIGIMSRKNMGRTQPLSGADVQFVDRDLLDQAHLCVLENRNEVQPYISEHMEHLRNTHPKYKKRTKWLQDKHNRTFIGWLCNRVGYEINHGSNEVMESLRWLVDGPCMQVPKYQSYIVNGVHFDTKSRDEMRVVQNSGVHLVAKTTQVSSAKDKNHIVLDMSFYGVIKEIWELDYHKFKIPIFKCDWVENNNGIKIEELGFILANLGRVGYKNDQFVLAGLVKQIFYIESKGSVVLSTPNRDSNDYDSDNVLGDIVIDHEPFTRG
ncbi:PREDICTED: uncharacterized protein LOC103337368 [Prunus mume]|uniref:Uncharacterized protein LOC103337368 n=1 Tax=Prunus mume TaxID=102107 RepID=A0ABM0PF50_PRUMU|nr:PREDICTED: uncharacterized protein LOC103337368 [Prunus mume]